MITINSTLNSSSPVTAKVSPMMILWGNETHSTYKLLIDCDKATSESPSSTPSPACFPSLPASN